MTQSPISDIRDLPENPFILFADWRADAGKTEINDPDACCLATVNKDGHPNARMVLVKSFDERGFIFHTNESSRKGQDMSSNPNVAVCFHWKSLRRQVKISGTVEETSAEDADTYFAGRSRESRLGAWASQQSSPLESYDDLIAAHEKYEKEFEGQDVPRPPYWKGFRIIPTRMEFWLDGAHRLHHRFTYEKQGVAWTTVRLYP